MADANTKKVGSYSRTRRVVLAVLTILTFIGVICLWHWSWAYTEANFPELTRRGQFGDSFGFINSLFSGLAFLGLLVAIGLQREDLRIQAKMLEEQVNESRVMANAMKEQVRLFTEQTSLQTMPMLSLSNIKNFSFKPNKESRKHLFLNLEVYLKNNSSLPALPYEQIAFPMSETTEYMKVKPARIASVPPNTEVNFVFSDHLNIERLMRFYKSVDTFDPNLLIAIAFKNPASRRFVFWCVLTIPSIGTIDEKQLSALPDSAALERLSQAFTGLPSCNPGYWGIESLVEGKSIKRHVVERMDDWLYEFR